MNLRRSASQPAQRSTRICATGNRRVEPLPWPRRAPQRAASETASIHKDLVSRWQLKAERLAKLPKLEQGCWHAYRRLWAVERKGLPDVDVAAAGGWRDTRALKLSYQQADPATMLRVVEGA